MPEKPINACPKRGDDPAKFKAFFDRYCDNETPARCERLAEYGLAERMVQGIQWLMLPKQSDPRRAYRWVEDDADVPKPVENRILEIVDNEEARQANRKSKPKVRARSGSERAGGSAGPKAGAELAEEILIGHLDSMQYDRKRRRAISKRVRVGTAVMESRSANDWLNTSRTGISGALRCFSDQCHAMLASADIPPEAMLNDGERFAQLQESGQIAKDERFYNSTQRTEVKITAKSCLQCGAPMQSVQATPQEASQKDEFGRSLGQDMPRWEPKIDVWCMSQVFLPNDGLGITPEYFSGESWELATVDPVDLDDLAAEYNLEVEDGRYYKRYESGERVEVLTEDPKIVADSVLNLGEFGSGSAGSSTVDERRIFTNHVRRRRYFRGRTKREPMGRLVVMAGNVLLEDGDLYFKSDIEKGLLIPKSRFAFARYFERDGELAGLGIVKPLVSLQRRVNMILSQVTSTRERCGIDGVVAPTGMRLTSPGWVHGFSGQVLYYEQDPTKPDKEPKAWPSRTIDSGVYNELDRAIAAMREISGIQDVDVGKGAGGQRTATETKLLQDKSSERREPRHEEFAAMEREIWLHQALLLREKVRDPETRKYWAINAATNTWEEREFKGSDLAGMRDLVVEEESGYDQDVYEQQRLQENIGTPLVPIDTPLSRYETAKALGLPPAITESQNVQIESARRKWYLFKTDGTVPIVDESLDDHWIHYQEYGKQLKTLAGVRMEEDAQVPQILELLAGWQQQMQTLDMIAAQIPMLMTQARDANVPVDPQIQEFATRPPLPKATAQKILAVWDEMAMGITDERGMPMLPQAPSTMPAMQFRAVVEAHKLLAEGLKVAAGTTAPVAAPGGSSTPAGTEPAAGQPVMPAAGQAAPMMVGA